MNKNKLSSTILNQKEHQSLIKLHSQNLREVSCLTQKTNDCESDSIVMQNENYGRRIYIHEQSFDYLASQSIVGAKLIFSALGSVPIIKLFHHLVVEDGVLTEMISAPNANSLLNGITAHWSSQLTNAFQKIGFRSSEPMERYNFFPLLSNEEFIVATCFDINYYTFATTKAAAIRMYMDNESIHELKSKIKEKEYDDLTIIKGHSLALIDSANGIGKNKAKYYTQLLNSNYNINGIALIELKKQIVSTIFQELNELINKYLPHPLTTEKKLLNDVIHNCYNSISMGILKLS